MTLFILCTVIAGQEVEKEHCVIENANSTVTLIPLENSACFVNGNLVKEPSKLTQGELKKENIIILQRNF